MGAGLNGIIFDDLVFKVTAFLKSNISKTVHFRDKVTKEH